MDSLWTTGFGEFAAVRGGLLQERAPWKDGKKLGGGREEKYRLEQRSNGAGCFLLCSVLNPPSNGCLKLNLMSIYRKISRRGLVVVPKDHTAQ